MNDPMIAWILQVYLRDHGVYLWLAPSARLYGGFAARAEKYLPLSCIYIELAFADAECIQDAARSAAEQVEGFAWEVFEAWGSRKQT